MAFLVGLVFAFLWDLLIAFLVVILFNVIGIPVLAALTFWQVFGLLIVISLATTKVGS